MSGHTCAWRCLYSSRRSRRTCSWKQTRCMSSSCPVRAGPRSGPTRTDGSSVRSEVELVDVRLVEHERVAEQDRAVVAHGVLAQLAAGEGVALLAGNLLVHQGLRGVGGEVAEVLGVPERELLDGAVLDVLAHLVRGAEAGHVDLPLGARGGDVGGGGRGGGRGG